MGFWDLSDRAEEEMTEIADAFKIICPPCRPGLYSLHVSKIERDVAYEILCLYHMADFQIYHRRAIEKAVDDAWEKNRT